MISTISYCQQIQLLTCVVVVPLVPVTTGASVVVVEVVCCGREITECGLPEPSTSSGTAKNNCKK